jgi:hypothetical protein
MDIRKPEPTAVKVIAIFQLVFGILGLVCGLFALAGGAAALQQGKGGGGGQAAGGLDEASIQKMMDEEMPHHKTLETAETGVSLILSVLMVASGAGLLNRQAWGRTLAIVYAVSSIIFHIVDLLVALVVVVPGMMAVADKIAAKAGANGGVVGGAMKTGMFAGLFFAGAVTIYPIIVLVIMLRPGVKAALSGEAGDERFDGPRDYDDRRDRGPYGEPRDYDDRREGGGGGEPDDRTRPAPDDRYGPN